MDISLFRSQARDLLQEKKDPLLKFSLAYFGITALLGLLSFYLTMPSGGWSAYLNAFESGDWDSLMYAASKSRGSVSFLSNAISFLSQIIFYGFLMMLLNAMHHRETVIGNLFDGFSLWWQIILMEFLKGLLIGLAAILFIIPGIILAYSYRLSSYLLITNPQMDIIDCMKESRMRMRGHKFELFTLDLSFIGWILLSVIPILGWILNIWLTPYINLARLYFCEALCPPAPQPEPVADDSFYE
jgi:hypothetical protein